MAIKKLRFSFDVPLQDLLALVATRNDALHIDVVGDGRPDKPPKQLKGPAAKIAGLLEAPGKGKGKGNHGNHSRKVKAQDEFGPLTTYQAVAIFLFHAPDHTGAMPQMKAALAPLGVNEVSISPQMAKMRADGNAKQIVPGTYKLTPQGVRNFEKLIKEREAKGTQT